MIPILFLGSTELLLPNYKYLKHILIFRDVCPRTSLPRCTSKPCPQHRLKSLQNPTTPSAPPWHQAPSLQITTPHLPFPQLSMAPVFNNFFLFRNLHIFLGYQIFKILKSLFNFRLNEHWTIFHIQN